MITDIESRTQAGRGDVETKPDGTSRLSRDVRLKKNRFELRVKLDKCRQNFTAVSICGTVR